MLTGVLWQPSFAVANVVRMMRLLIGHRFVSFPYSDTSGSILQKRKTKEHILGIFGENTIRPIES